MPVSSTSKNILFISTMTGSPWGGSEVLWYLTALKALKEGHEVSIYYKYWGDQESHHLSNLRSLGAEIRYYGQPKEDQLPVSFLDKLRHLINRNSAFEIRKKERKDTREEPAGDHFYGVDVVCVSQGTTYDIVNRSDIRELIESLQKPYILIAQFNYDYGFSLPMPKVELGKEIFRKAFKVVFVSETNKIFAEHQLFEDLSKRAHVLNNPFKVINKKPMAYPKSETMVFASVARLHCKTKALDIVIKCFAQSEWKERNWVYHIYGSGPDEAYLKALIKFYKLENKVVLKGHQTDVTQIWEHSHILVLPSLAEGTPLSLQEAMICARPAIVTDIAGNTELVENGHSGFVAEAPSFNSLSAIMNRAWKEQERWQEMGVEAFRYVKENLTLNPEHDLYEILIHAASE
jgi:glycosyltransferase involved in cell wall biosynthesis